MKEDITPIKALIMFLADIGTVDFSDDCNHTVITRIENLYSDISHCTSEDQEQFRIEIEKVIQSPDMSSDVIPFLRDLTQYISEQQGENA